MFSWYKYYNRIVYVPNELWVFPALFSLYMVEVYFRHGGLTCKLCLAANHLIMGDGKMKNPNTFRTLATLFAATAVSMFCFAPPAVAGDLTQQELIDSLTVVKTRNFDPGRKAREVKFRSFVNTLRTKKTRQITVGERAEVAKFVKENDLPGVDLEVFFDYNSAMITPAAKPKLETLGKALSDAKLKGKTFMIAGHTDGTGSDDYNQSLSEKRADAVKQHLASKFGLDVTTLVAIGYGEEQLKTPGAPEADENRRVQVVTLGE